MTRGEIYQQVESIFRDVFDDDTLTVQDETNAEDIEDWDSLAQISLLSAMESAFSLKFQIDDVLNLKNVGEMVDLIQAKLAG